MASIIVKVTREQHRAVRREAKRRGITISDLVRLRVLDRKGGDGEDATRASGTVRGETGLGTKREA